MNSALVVKKSDNEWEVVEKYDLTPDRLEKFMGIYEGPDEITGMATGEHYSTAYKGATWNGSSFSGGDKPVWVDDATFAESFKTYVLLGGNVVFMILSASNNSILQDKLDAAFASEVTLVPILPGQEANIGSIWNGNDFLESN